MQIHVKVSTVPKVLLCIICLLLCLHLAQLVAYFVIADSDKFDFIELVDFDYEGNLPAFYSAIALFMAAALLALIAVKKNSENAPFRLHWKMLSVIFLWLMLDEALGLHEELGDYVESLHLFAAEGFLYFAWVVPYGLLLTVFFISYLNFTFSLPTKTKHLFILSGSVFVTGAIGIEVMSAQEADLHGSNTIMYSALYTLEELCEMLGILLFIYALLDYIRREFGDIHLSLK